jgi:predicted RNase H-like HicB family nuclease
MRFQGKLSKVGNYWAVDVPILGVATQGRTRKEAFEMIRDAIELLAGRHGFEVQVFPGTEGYFEVGSADHGTLGALLLKRVRTRSGLTLAQVTQRLGARSLNAYARYEQGRCAPTLPKLLELLSAAAGAPDFVLSESHV